LIGTVEAGMDVTTTAGVVTADVAGANFNGAPTTLTFTGEFAPNYDPSADGTLDLLLSQSYDGSDANWSNISVSITLAPACPNPAALAVTNIMSTSADFNWTAGNTETEWEYAESPQLETDGDVTGTPNTDVWYVFTATGTDHRIELQNVVNQGGGTSTSTDMGMAVYDATGGCDALVLVGSSDPNTYNVTGLTAGMHQQTMNVVQQRR